jgi:hypothetical protein
VYIPEVNFLIGVASVAVTLAFQTTDNIGNAYGICVVTVFSITTHLMAVVMLLVWRTHPALVAAFYLGFGFVEFLYLSSIMSKFAEGGYLPFCFALVLMALMASWHYVHVRSYWYELDRAVPAAELARPDVRRVPGVGLLYSELVQGIPPVFPHLVDKIPSVHAVLVFVSVKHLPIPRVLPPERFIFRRVGPAGGPRVPMRGALRLHRPAGRTRGLRRVPARRHQGVRRGGGRLHPPPEPRRRRAACADGGGGAGGASVHRRVGGARGGVPDGRGDGDSGGRVVGAQEGGGEQLARVP